MDYVIAIGIIIVAGYLIWGRGDTKTGPSTGGSNETPTDNTE
jgi:hypothetical protein